MVYNQRLDGRKFDELRPIEAKAGVVPNARGSAWFKIGKTEAIAAVYGPKEVFPRFKKNPLRGIIQCYYNMMPFSGMGDRVRPGGNRRSKEISEVMNKAFEPVLDMTDFPNLGVDVFVELPKTDAGSRCASICAASIALADAGFKMKDLVASVAVGIIDEQVVVDLDYNEESFDGVVADIPVVIVPSTGEFSLLQLDGKISKEKLIEALKLSQEKVAEIIKVQREALVKKYEEN
jgi:exosome complex component RRP41